MRANIFKLSVIGYLSGMLRFICVILNENLYIIVIASSKIKNLSYVHAVSTSTRILTKLVVGAFRYMSTKMAFKEFKTCDCKFK